MDLADLGEPRVKRPLLRFLALGIALFALERSLGQRRGALPPSLPAPR